MHPFDIVNGRRQLARGTMEQFVDSLFNQRAAAQFLGISVRTLERYRVSGTGPRFCRLGHRLVRYREADLEEWVRQSLRASTSESSETIVETAARPPKSA